MNHRHLALTVCFSLAVCASCLSTPVQVSTSDIKSISGNIAIGGKKCAVIAGDSNALEQIYAYSLTESFHSASDIPMLTQEQVKEKYPDYPLKIKGPFGLTYFNVEIDYAKTDISRIAEIQKKLKTDYILVVWLPSSIKTNSMVKISGVIQMFSFPDAREVAHGSFNTSYTDNGALKKEDLFNEIIRSFKRSSDSVAKDLASRLGISKAAY